MFTYVLLLATLPSLAVLVIFFWADRYEKESLFLLFRSFAYGVALPLPIGILQAVFQEPYQALTSVQQAVWAAPLLEEGLKYMVVLGVLYPSADLNEPYDGILYYVACGVGFAVHEDIGYILHHSLDGYLASVQTGDPTYFYSDSASITLLRSIPGHALFAAVSGYCLGRARCDDRSSTRLWLMSALGGAILTHMLFNGIASTTGLTWLLVYTAVLCGGVVLLVRDALARSPFAAPSDELSILQRKALRDSAAYREGNAGLFGVLTLLGLAWVGVMYGVSGWVYSLIATQWMPALESILGQ